MNNDSHLILKERSLFVKNMHWPFFGSFMQQTPNAVLSINRLLNDNNFRRIIEIGTHDAGLSIFLALYCNLSKRLPQLNSSVGYKARTTMKTPRDFFTFDVVMRDESMTDLVQRLGGHAIIQDVFDPLCISGVGSLIKKEGQSLLICDGGNKKREFEVYSPILKQGDIIMAHDYARDATSFEKVKNRGIWHGWETKWEGEPSGDFGLKDVCEANHIEQIHADEFDDSVWFVGVKTA